jgi:hypothetical protein
MDELEVSHFKPIINLTKKSFTAVCEHIRQENPEHAGVIIPAMTEAFKERTGFDINQKTSVEKMNKQKERRKQILENENTTEYEKYKRPRYNRLKETYPDVAPRMLITHSLAEIQKIVNNKNISVTKQYVRSQGHPETHAQDCEAREDREAEE